MNQASCRLSLLCPATISLTVSRGNLLNHQKWWPSADLLNFALEMSTCKRTQDRPIRPSQYQLVAVGICDLLPSGTSAFDGQIFSKITKFRSAMKPDRPAGISRRRAARIQTTDPASLFLGAEGFLLIIRLLRS